MIPGYLDSLAQALGFDPALARRVRQEAEDHLREAVAADSADGALAEQRAIADFGDPRVIAARFALISLARQTRRSSLAVGLVIAGVFAAMKVRLAWYAVIQSAVGAELRELSGFVGAIDRTAFWVAALAALAGCALIARRHGAAIDAAYRRQLRSFFLLCLAATGALAVSVIGDGVLTALRLGAMEIPTHAAIPLVSMALEIAAAAGLAVLVCRAARRAAAAAAFLET